MKKCEEKTPNFYVPKGCEGCSVKYRCKTYNIYKECMAQGFINSFKKANSFIDINFEDLIKEINELFEFNKS